MKILLPVDGSAYSNAALEFIAARPPLNGGHPQIDLLNVQLPIPPRAGRAVGAEVVRAWHDAEATAVLKPARARLQQAGLEPAVFYRVGSPGVEIAGWADEHGTDLIVMGSHGRTAAKGLLLGSVAQNVLAGTRVPLLVIRAPRAPKGSSLRVGLALDGSRHSVAAARYVLEHRRLFGPDPAFALIHVIESSDPGARVACERFVAPLRRRFVAAGLALREEVLVGRPAEEIARFATQARLDILAIGTHGRGGLTRALMGSVAWRVAATCSTPLLLIRAED